MSLCSPLYRRVPAQVPYHKWTMRLEITALMRLPESLTGWNKKRLPEEQLKKVTSPKVFSVKGHFLLLVGGRQSPLLEMKKQLAP